MTKHTPYGVDDLTPPDEDPIALGDVGKVPGLIPRRPGSPELHRSRPYAWHKTGRRGHRLRAIRGVGGLLTYPSWVREFLTAISGANARSSVTLPRSPVQRRRTHTAAERALDRAGIA